MVHIIFYNISTFIVSTYKSAANPDIMSVNPYNFSNSTIGWLFNQGQAINDDGTCETSILKGELSLPNIGFCDESPMLLFAACVATFIIQFLRHWLWDLTSVHKFNILSKDHGSRDLYKIFIFSMIQLGKTLLWVISLLIIVNANIAVIITHIFADVISCAYWIWKTQRFNKNPLDTDRIIKAIQKDPAEWQRFIDNNRKWYMFTDKELEASKPDVLKDPDPNNAAGYSNSDPQAAAFRRRVHPLTF